MAVITLVLVLSLINLIIVAWRGALVAISHGMRLGISNDHSYTSSRMGDHPGS